MGKKMDKAEVIFPPKSKQISPGEFVWLQAEKAIVEKIGEKNKASIKKTEALEAILKARDDKNLKDAYVKIGPLDGQEHLVLRIKAVRLLKDYEDDYVLVKDYRSMVAQLQQGQQQLQEFIESEKQREQKVDTSSPMKNFRALEQHTINREESLKTAKKIFEEFKPYLKKAQELRRGGKATLTQNRSLVKVAVEKELEFVRVFSKNREALQTDIAQALNRTPELKSEIASMRKRSGIAFDAGMRLMAEIRDIKDSILTELQEHELDAEKVGADFLRSDELRLKQLKVLQPQLEDLLRHGTARKLASWRKIKDHSDAGILAHRKNPEGNWHYTYTTMRDEAEEAFKYVESYSKQFLTLQKRIALLFTGDPRPGPSAAKEIYQVFDQTKPVVMLLKQAPQDYEEFKQLIATCNKKWEEALGD